jgi:hypothetical protein
MPDLSLSKTDNVEEEMNQATARELLLIVFGGGNTWESRDAMFSLDW